MYLSERMNLGWRDVQRHPPKCGQVVLGLLQRGPLAPFRVALVYVVKARGRRRYGIACTDVYREEDALLSVQCDDQITAYMLMADLVPQRLRQTVGRAVANEPKKNGKRMAKES